MQDEEELENGYLQLFWGNGRVMVNLYYINGVAFGPSTSYERDGLIKEQEYYAR